MSNYFWQKWLSTKADAGLSAFLRPKDAQKIEQNKGVTEMSESRVFSFFIFALSVQAYIAVFHILSQILTYKECV